MTSILWEGWIVEYTAVGSFPSSLKGRLVITDEQVVAELMLTDTMGAPSWRRETDGKRCCAMFSQYVKANR